MTARTVPAEPELTTTSEQLVFERVRDALPSEAVVLANFRLTDEHKDHEADLVVLIPDAGILVLEVKGGNVTYDGDWRQHTSYGERKIRPVAQARDAEYAIREYVEHDPRWSRSRVVWSHGVVVPFSAFPDDFAHPELPRAALHDRGDLADLALRLPAQGTAMRQGNRPPTREDVDLIVEILRGRGFTTADTNAKAAERRAVADRLTEQQAMILQATRMLHRVEVRGGAGSGKTMLALTQARQLTQGRDERPAQRVALLCYSIGLAEFLKRVVDTWPRQQRPAFVGTFHELGRRWGAPDGDRENSAFWEEELPGLMADLASDLTDEDRFDSIIVDEAQDFADLWWTPLLRALRDEEQSGLYVYSDENQRIFARFGQPPVRLVPLVLDDNLRNTRQIHEAFNPLAPTRMRSRGSDGPAVAFLDATGHDVVARADEAVGVLLDIGWHPGNIALLTTGRRHHVQVSEVERLGPKGYWGTYWDEEEVFFGHVLGCKGLERPAVVLCVNEDASKDRSREKLYVGMSRATDQLIVVGERAVVREIGGEAVAERLGIGVS